MSDDLSRFAKFKDFWQRLWRIPRYRIMLGIPVGGLLMFVVGIVFVAVTGVVIHATGTEKFCISCHEMEATVYQEYVATSHYNNASGVRATCSDCHIPQEWPDKLIVKTVSGIKDITHHLLGTLDTAEKFEAHRARMAEQVWEAMRKTDSRECRHCHSYEAMELSLQGRSASRKHSAEWRERKNETCIDCHQGLVHKLPEI